jgi:hypothetical protein
MGVIGQQLPKAQHEMSEMKEWQETRVIEKRSTGGKIWSRIGEQEKGMTGKQEMWRLGWMNRRSMIALALGERLDGYLRPGLVD